MANGKYSEKDSKKWSFMGRNCKAREKKPEIAFHPAPLYIVNLWIKIMSINSFSLHIRSILFIYIYILRTYTYPFHRPDSLGRYWGHMLRCRPYFFHPCSTIYILCSPLYQYSTRLNVVSEVLSMWEVFVDLSCVSALPIWNILGEIFLRSPTSSITFALHSAYSFSIDFCNVPCARFSHDFCTIFPKLSCI